MTSRTYGNSSESLELLAIAPHPDDAEIGCGGTLLVAAAQGKRTGILELTRGELGTLGTPEMRDAEAVTAAKILGLAYRGNLRWADGSVIDGSAYRLELAAVIRELRPRVLLVPHEMDRHPDHTGAARVALSGVHFAALKNAPLNGEPHRVAQVLHYQGNAPINANVLVDVSSVMDRWQQAVMAHASQFTGAEVSSTVSPLILERRKARMIYWGAFAGVQMAEGFESYIPLIWHP